MMMTRKIELRGRCQGKSELAREAARAAAKAGKRVVRLTGDLTVPLGRDGEDIVSPDWYKPKG